MAEQSVTLEQFVGEHELGGVDMSGSGDANGVVFVVDGVSYQALEDESDGYRSMLGELKVVDAPVKNVFQAVRCVGKMRGEILELTDAQSGKTVLELGTDDSDDYYPSFVCNFTPEAMSVNQ